MKKSFIVLLALVLIVGIAVGGTVAWLTATSDKVTNTFTVGDINIKLEETGATNNQKSYKIVPGATDSKDPTVTVIKSSEKCYVYVKVTNNLVLNGTTVVTPDINTENWIKVGTNGNTTLYRYKNIVDAASADQTLAVFTKVTYSDSITKNNIETLKNQTIEIEAYAHQSDSIESISVADTAANAWAGTTAVATA